MKEDHFYYYITQGFSIVTINTLQKYPRKSFFSYLALLSLRFILFVSPWATYTRIYIYIFFLLFTRFSRWFTDRLFARLFKKEKKKIKEARWWFKNKNEQFTRRSNTVWISFNQSQHKWLKTGGDCLILFFHSFMKASSSATGL